MKRIFTIIAAFGLALPAFCGSPVYKTLSANGNAATPAFLIFPSDPTTQIRIVNVTYTSDTNNGAITFTPCVAAYAISSSNAAGTTITVSQTNGLAANDSLIIQRAGGLVTNVVISAFSGPTNITLTGTSANTTLPGDEVFKLGTAVTLFVGIGTNSINGEAIFVANPARPLTVLLSPALVTNRLSGVSAHYD